MVLQHINADTIVIKTGATSAAIKTDGTIRIGDHDITGPGEYDIAAIGVHVFPTYASLFCEGIRVAIVKEAMVTAEGDEDDSDILLLLTEDIKLANATLKQVDPRIVVVHSEVLAAELAKSDGAEVKRESSYKVTTQTLPADDRDFVLLA